MKRQPECAINFAPWEIWIYRRAWLYSKGNRVSLSLLDAELYFINKLRQEIEVNEFYRVKQGWNGDIKSNFLLKGNGDLEASLDALIF